MHNISQGSPVLDDATLYDYGLGAWQRIISRIPGLIHDLYDPEFFEQEKAEALAEAFETKAAEDAKLEEQGYTKSEDGTHW